MEIEKLKAENDRLKVENQGSRMGSQASISSSPPPHSLGQAPGSGPGLSQHSLNLTTSESTSLGKTRPPHTAVPSGCEPCPDCASGSSDMLLDDTGEGGLRKEGRHVRMVVSLDEDRKWGEVRPPADRGSVRSWWWSGFWSSASDSCSAPSQDERHRRFLIGCIGVSGKTKWDVLDGVVRRLFKVTRGTCLDV